MNKLIALTVFVVFGCTDVLNKQSEKICLELKEATGLPSKIAKINGWSECYLKCPNSWVPADGFHGCRQ